MLYGYKIPGGVEMTDIVHYKIPFWFMGDIATHYLYKMNSNKYSNTAIER